MQKGLVGRGGKSWKKEEEEKRENDIFAHVGKFPVKPSILIKFSIHTLTQT